MPYVYNFDQPPTTDAEESRLLLGGKGHNLAVMRTELGLPVPPGFTITTEAGKGYLESGWPDRLDEEISEQMERVEDEVGRKFGGDGEPLLVSVRSGAAVSMPGMMDTILNLGLNDLTESALARVCDDPAFADESRRRFEKMYREIVGGEVPTDPWDQLRGAIVAVFQSWNTDRARSYREREGIPHDLGTAVTVQSMVFGNLDENSGTGVLFTRNPATGERAPYGDILFQAQGEDVVAGTHSTESVERLAEHLPDVAAELEAHAETLERHFRDVCDIEFTVERSKLWLLQVRVGKRSPQAALRFAVDMAEEKDFPLTRPEAVERVAYHLVNPPVSMTRIGPEAEQLAVGLPASPGLATGQIATTADAAVAMADEGRDVILVRPETSPNDVHGMACVRGILTSRGGLASHAAVVARGWGTPAVVGAEDVEVNGDTVVIAGHAFAEGEVLTINGSSGEIFAGTIETETVVTPEAQTLISWAEEGGIDIAALIEPQMSEDPTNDAKGDLTDDEVIRALHLKGFVTPDGLSPVVLAPVAAVESTLSRLEGSGVVKPMGEMFQLTDVGKQRGADLWEQDRADWATESADEALEGFLPLDQRMKELVTAWQMREVDGEQVLNDHSDQEYDRTVLENLHDLHESVREWLTPLTTQLTRLEVYLTRLDRAVAQIRNGEHAYIASPRLDSYHNVWFELHEDLIQLAGRTREEETKAGRA